MDKVRDILLFFSAAMAVFSLICAVYQAMNDKVASAIALAGMFLVCVLVVFLPKLEVLEAFGVKAHLVKTLNEAEEILAKLRQLSITSAKATYRGVGTGGRMGPSSAVGNQAMLDEIDNQLRVLGVSEKERRELSSTYVRLMGFDFYMMYARTLERYFQFKLDDMVRQSNKEPENASLKKEVERWREGKKTWHPNYNLYSQLLSFSLDDETNKLVPKGWLSERDQLSVLAYRDEILTLFKETEAKGGLTPRAAAYVDEYRSERGPDKKIIELFDFDPSATR